MLDTKRLETALLASSDDALREERFSRYELLEEISRGGNGVVVKARHRELGALVALKLLLQDDPSAEARARFRREAQVLARLDHPNVVGVTDLGEENGVPYIAMDLIVGRDLGEIARASREPLGYDWIVRMMTDVGEALHHCHERDVVHRDVKPQNVLEEEATWRAVLTDFGLVWREPGRMTETLTALSERSAALTKTGLIVGTPSYMAPEQLDAERFGAVGPKTDVWGWGATLYFLITGRPPVGRGDVLAVLHALLERPIRPPRELRPDVPDFLGALCAACLQKRPADRPSMRQALARLKAPPERRARQAPARAPERATAVPVRRAPEAPVGTRRLPIRLVRLTAGFALLAAAAIVYLAVIDPRLGMALVAGFEERPGAAAVALGRSYLHGTVFARDPATARELLELAAEHDHPEASYWLGHIALEGELGGPDPDAALARFEAAAASGYEPALLWVGHVYRSGAAEGGPDLPRAVGCYERALDCDDPDVVLEAEAAIDRVVGDCRDRAAEGDGRAMLWLAFWLERGLADPDGAPDPLTALHYYELARTDLDPRVRRRAEAGVRALRRRYPELR